MSRVLAVVVVLALTPLVAHADDKLLKRIGELEQNLQAQAAYSDVLAESQSSLQKQVATLLARLKAAQGTIAAMEADKKKAAEAAKPKTEGDKK